MFLGFKGCFFFFLSLSIHTSCMLRGAFRPLINLSLMYQKKKHIPAALRSQ